MIELKFTDNEASVLGDSEAYAIEANVKIKADATSTEVIEALIRIMHLAGYCDQVIANGLKNNLDVVDR